MLGSVHCRYATIRSYSSEKPYVAQTLQSETISQ